jgi:hypothetical protein
LLKSIKPKSGRKRRKRKKTVGEEGRGEGWDHKNDVRLE